MKAKSLVTILGLTLALSIGVITTNVIAAAEQKVSYTVLKQDSTEEAKKKK